MKTELIDHSPTRKELHIEIEANKVREEYERVTQRYMKVATVAGFRPGHAPQAIVRQRFKDEIRSEVLREIVPQALQEAIEDENLEVLGEPDVEFADEASLEKFGDVPLTLHAKVEVFPEIELGEYKGIEVARRVRPVTDEDLDMVIDGLRESAATLAPVEDRGAEDGDTVTVNFRGIFTGEPGAEPINVEEVDVVLGGEGILAEFNQNLMGVRPDEERAFTIAYPEDFTSKGLAGKTIEYTAKVVAVRRKELPELDDEFAKGLDEEGIETMESLRARIRETLEARSRAEAEVRVQGELMDELINRHQFEVPQSLINMQTRRLLEQTMREMYQHGLDPRADGLDWQSLRGSMEGQAIFDLRGSILLERIADEEAIDASYEEVEAEINALATASRRSVDEVRTALTKQGGDRSIADRLRNRKALEVLAQNAQIRDEEWREEEPEIEAEEASQADVSEQTSEATDEAGETPKADEAGAQS